MSLTTREIQDYIENHEFVDEGIRDWGLDNGQPYRDVDTGIEWWADEVEMHERVSVEGLGNVQKVEEETGGEGAGSLMYIIFKVELLDGTVRYFRQEGYYSSYDGSGWDSDFSEVEPYSKMTTFYRKVK